MWILHYGTDVYAKYDAKKKNRFFLVFIYKRKCHLRMFKWLVRWIDYFDKNIWKIKHQLKKCLLNSNGN